jgi:hypothetical protein
MPTVKAADSAATWSTSPLSAGTCSGATGPRKTRVRCQVSGDSQRVVRWCSRYGASCAQRERRVSAGSGRAMKSRQRSAARTSPGSAALSRGLRPARPAARSRAGRAARQSRR